MMKKSMTGLLAVCAIILGVMFAMLENDSAQASEASSHLAKQQINLAELYKVQDQLIEFGEENSDLYLAVLNAIDTTQELVDEVTYWQDNGQYPASN